MNGVVVLGRFLHGLVFFTLGLTVFSLQSHSRRILLARRLYWMGLFALGEAVVAWNDLFAAMTPPVPLFPGFVRPVLSGMSYICLITFGIQPFFSEETGPMQGRRWLVGLNVVWVISSLGAYVALPVQRETVIQVTTLLAHALLGFAGGLLAAIGVRRQSYQTLEVTLRQRIRPYLQLVEVAAGTFGLLHLLYWPWWMRGMAPALTEWVWVLVGAALTLGINRALNTLQLETERWIEGVERLQTLAVDRERIGRDLHDGIIQSIYAAGLLLESVQPIIPSDPMRAQAQLGRVMDNLNETIQDIRRYIFDLRSDMPDDDLPSGIKRLLRDFHINTLLETELTISGTPVEILSMERRRHIFQIVRETLANTARHARARGVKVQLEYGEHALDLTISDDGIGMETLQVSKGYGLRNIRERVRLLDGTLRIESALNEGVTFHLTVPY
ncbi:MAG TPA: sensor histidine kinase [Anaerolineae bacterium]|nr:sensor histidine kinase [Anaerolineae bacterium]HQH39345.1 sensor histidine kinase [Anaerolineae bacterium]